MARNGSGTYTLSDTVTNATTVDADELNAIFTDLGNEITNSVALDGQSTMTGPLKAANGSAAAPAHAFGSDTDTGAYRVGSNTYGIAAGGSLVAQVDSTGLTVTGAAIASGQFRASDGSASAPGFSFSGDTNTGIYRIGADTIGIAVNGALIVTIDTDGLELASGKAVSGTGAIDGASIADGDLPLAKLANQNNQTLLANISGSAGPPTAQTLSALLDYIVTSGQGGILKRGSSAWQKLDRGTAGYLLEADSSDIAWSGNSSVRARGTGTSLTGTPALATGAVNFSGVSLNGAAVRFTFSTALASTNYQVIPVAVSSPYYCYISAKATTHFDVSCYSDGGSPFTPSSMDVVVYGGW